MTDSKTQKLYCYVDETGQDTKGKLFIVAVVLTDTRRNELEAALDQIELDSGKKKRKWRSTRAGEREAYVKAVASGKLPGEVFTRISTAGGGYEDLEV